MARIEADARLSRAPAHGAKICHARWHAAPPLAGPHGPSAHRTLPRSGARYFVTRGAATSLRVAIPLGNA